jgi:hypothetical protein
MKCCGRIPYQRSSEMLSYHNTTQHHNPEYQLDYSAVYGTTKSQERISQASHLKVQDQHFTTCHWTGVADHLVWKAMFSQPDYKAITSQHSAKIIQKLQEPSLHIGSQGPNKFSLNRSPWCITTHSLFQSAPYRCTGNISKSLSSILLFAFSKHQYFPKKVKCS